MATVAELAARDHVEVGYLLVAQGLPFMFTNRPELAGTGASSWIGTSYGPRRVIEGLDVRGTTIAYGTEMSSGRPDTDDGATFKILDFGRELIELFRVQTDAVPVGGRLGPKDDPAPTDLIGTSGLNVPIWGKWVNAEAIGPAGERSYYSLLPGGDPAGQDHAAYSGDVQSLAPSYVYYASPTHLEGRRVALYRIFRDLDTGEWPSWEDQHDSGESLIWVGSLTNEVEVEDIEWTLKAEGPSSWQRKQLGSQRPAEWAPVSGDITLSTVPGKREDLIALSFIYQQVSDSNVEYGGASFFTASDVLSPTGTAATWRGEINARIATVSASAGADITWTTDRNAEANIASGYVETRIDETPPASFIKAALWACGAHEKVWRALGFDPYAQKATFFDTDLEVHFVAGEESGIPALPGAGYWVGHFWTVPVGFNTLAAAGPEADNSGKFRRARAIAPEDIAQLPPGAGFELSFGIGSPAYLEGQTNRATAEHALSNTGGDCDTQGYVAFRGSYLAGPDAEVTTMVQLAQVCWRNDSVVTGGDTIGLDSKDHARVFVAKWIDPRFHGCDRKPPERIWASADLEWCPVNFFGHAFYSGDYAHRMLLRLLLSTGTATWLGFDGDGAVLTAGANHPTYLDGLEPYSDAEIADLGLGIPHELIDLPSFGTAAGSLPGGITSPLNRCRYAWIGAQDSQDLIAAVLAPRGWGLGFNRGQWRLFSRPDVLTGEDVEVVITADDIVGEPDFVERASMRPFTPREKFTVDFSKALVSDAATDDRELKLTAKSLDPSSRSRRDNGADDVEGWGLIPIPLWRGEGAPGDWRSAWNILFARIMGGWFNAAHTLVSGLPVLPSIARQLGPGSVVRFTSYYAPTREGTYGPTGKLGRVYKVEHDLESRGATIDVLLQPGDSSESRHFAPGAIVRDDVATVEARYNAATRTFYCFADGFEHSDADLHDLRYFIEPAWLGVGGEAVVHGWQHNGREWSKTFEFTAESVDLVGNSITYKAGSMSGTFGESCYTLLVLAPWDDQPVGSWVREFFSVITQADFTFGAGPTQGFPLV